MSETYPRKTLCETLFAGHTPSSVGFDCKGTTKFADVQILSGKSFRSFKSFKGERRTVPTVSCLANAKRSPIEAYSTNLASRGIIL